MKNNNWKSIKLGFSLVEMILVIGIIGILSGGGYYLYGQHLTMYGNERVSNDLVAISNALEAYQRDHLGSYPVPGEGGSTNVLCFNADATYAHDCDMASFRQAMIDSSLIPQRYMAYDMPVDPRTDSRYVYGISSDGRYFQVAGVVEGDNGWEAETISNIGKGFYLPSLIRAYDSPNFVTEGGNNLPYDPERKVISASLNNINGEVYVCPGMSDPDSNQCDSSYGTEDEDYYLASGYDLSLYAGDVVQTLNNGSVDIYFSDGSVSTLSEDSKLLIQTDSIVDENEDEEGTVTKIFIKLFSGKVWNKVIRLAERSEFNIETTSAIAGVRGTEFGVEINSGTGDQIIRVLTGTVTVEADDGSETEVIAEEKITVNEGGTAGSTNTLTSGEIADIETDYYSTTNLHSGMVPYFVFATPGTPYDFYISFNGLTTDDGTLLDNTENNGFEIYTDELAEGMIHADDITDVDYISTPGDPREGTYHFQFDYFDATDEAIAIRAFECIDTPDCNEKAYSSYSWVPMGFSSSYIWDVTEHAVSDVIYDAMPGLAFQVHITGSANASAYETVDLSSVTMNGDNHSPLGYSWGITEMPEGANGNNSSIDKTVDGDDTTAVFSAEIPGTYKIATNVWKIGSRDPVIDAYGWFVIEVGSGVCEEGLTDLYATNITDGDTGISINPTFEWYIDPPCVIADGLIDHYSAKIKDQVLTVIDENPTLASPNYTSAVTLLNETEYSLTIKAYNAAQDELDSLVIAFETEVVGGLGVCGDGALDTGEGEVCDDGNLTDNDGCSADCTVVETGYTCPTPGQDCECDVDYTEVGDTCEPLLLVDSCIGTDANDWTLALNGYENETMETYYDADDDACWVMGDAGDTCDAACSSVNLSCIDSNNGGVDWIDTNGLICNKIAGGSTPNLAALGYAPHFHTGLNRCYQRDGYTYNPPLDTLCNSNPFTNKRICKCLLM